MPSPEHPNCRCTTLPERETAPRAVARELECLHGPWDGERKLLEAGEDAIELHAEGRYVPVVTPIGERLSWRQDPHTTRSTKCLT